jgi:maltokinase
VTREPALAPLVRDQRWFGSKSRRLTGGRIADSGPLLDGCVLALFQAEFAEGGSELYQVPHRIADDGEIVLALSDRRLAGALVSALRRSARIPTRKGAISFELTGAFPAPAKLEQVRAVGAEQSNSSVVLGERCILKAYRRLADGESPELEMLRFLHGHGFLQIPSLLGWYGYSGAGLTATLGVLQEFAPGARDGWQDALEALPDPTRRLLGRLRRLGEVTGRMHVVLASDHDDLAFRPEERRSEEREEDATWLSGAPAPVRARRDELLGRLRELRRAGQGGKAIRQHGDYHLGQVLWARGDWLVIDFEGEPARPLAERRDKSTPLRDVAGMLRSLAYVAETGRGRGTPGSAHWEDEARAAFLAGYESAIDDSLLPPAGPARDALLAACELEKALYELRYELDNRPDWVHVPVAGILRLLDGNR